MSANTLWTTYWNDANLEHVALAIDALDRGSTANSLLFDLRANGVSKFSVRKDGTIFATAIVANIALPNSFFIETLTANVIIGNTANLGNVSITGTLTIAANSINANAIGGVLNVPRGGTGQGSYVTGDLLFASNTTFLSRLASVAIGSILASTGVGSAPAWTTAPAISGGNITDLNAANITTGTLGVARGGTGISNYGAANRLLVTTASTVIGVVTEAASSVLVTNGSNVPAWSTALPPLTGQLLVANGSPSAPSYSFTNANSTGISYHSSPPSLKFNVIGDDVLTVSATAIETIIGMYPLADNTLDFGLSISRWQNGYFGGSVFTPGVSFPVTQSPSADPNTLDDYEEGTWTPTIGGTGGESGQVYSIQNGFYVKVGRFVHVSCRVQLSTLGTITGVVQIKGLPFTTLNVTGYRATVPVVWGNLNLAVTNVTGSANENTTAFTLLQTAAATTSLNTQFLVQANLTNTTLFAWSLVYEADQ